MIEIGNIGSAPIQNVLEIKDVNNIVKCQYVMGDKDSLIKELMSRNDISISFNYPTFIKFKKGDYITFDGERYTLMKDFKTIDNKGEYRYELVFHAKEILIQDAQYFYTNSNIHQSEFTLTGNAQYFFQLVVEDINAHFGANFVNLGSIESTDIKQITFASNTNVLNALHQVCEVFGLEYLFAGDTINASKKVNFGDAIDFKVGESVLSVNRREGDNVFTANRILALGSTTNLTRDYQGGDYIIGSKRLRIPQSKGTFIDLKDSLQPTEIETATVIFDDIFPHRIGNVDEVREVEYEDQDEDGNDIILKQWRFKDNGIIFSEDYLLPNEPLMLVFESGRLAGQHFEVAFRKGNYNDTDNSQNYEILLNDRGLPNETLYPQIGDKYVLYNFNIALVSDIYIPEAENELYDTAVQWLKEQHTDKGVYECSIMTDYARTNDANLEIGQRVNLFAPMFDSNKRESRIMGYSKPLLDWSSATYTIGDNAAYSPKSNIQQRITKLEAFEYVDAGVGGASGSVYIIKQFDLTRPTDFNVYSAKASNAKYFNKQTGDTVQGDTLFQKNVQVQGNAITDVIQNSTFQSGEFGTGYQIKNDIGSGKSYMEVDNLRVRDEMIVSQLTIDEIKSVDGSVMLSLASLKAIDVQELTNAYRVLYDNQNGELVNKFTVGDQALCQTFNGGEIKRYWRLVTAVGDNYIELSKTDAETGSKVPTKDDVIVQFGHRTNVNRQYAQLISSYPPFGIRQYNGINSFSTQDKEITRIGDPINGNYFEASQFVIKSHGITSPIYRDRGLFANGTQYYKNDRVSWLSSLWVCISNTTSTPSDTSTSWRKETSGQGDINKAVDNIQIGSSNLTNRFAYWRLANANRAFIDSDTIILSKANKSRDGATLSENIKRTGLFIVSVGVKTSSPTKIYIDGRGGKIKSSHPQFQIKGDHLGYNIPSNFDGVISIYCDAGNTIIDNNWYCGIYGDSETDSCIFYKPKMEVGNKVTSWSLSDHDIEAGITNAQNIANNKMQVFVVQPYTPYQKGDLWVEGASGDILRCIQDRKTGGYNISDWDKASKYTDDTVANEANDKAKDALNEITVVRSDFNSELSVQNDKINSKVSQVDFDNLDDVVTNTRSDVEQLSGSLTTTIEKVDNIKIGGRNLIPYTNQGTTGWLRTVQNGTHSITETQALGVRAMKATTSVVSTGYNVITKNLNNALLKNNTQYVISFDVYCDYDTTMRFLLMASNGINALTPWCIQTVAKDTWIHVEQIMYTNNVPITNQKLYISGFNMVGAVTFANLKLEEGNKATSWSPAPEDVQSDIDSKAQTFYQDNEPTTKNVGDIWIKKALVDTNGVVNTDHSKNIYQLQMRWDGSTWQRINWSASKSKIEQTDSRITLEVNRIDGEIEEKTNITLDSNKISLAGKTIELKGSTIADSIEAEDLVVTGGNFQVTKEGVLSAKGANVQGKIESNESGNKIVINPSSRSFEMQTSKGKSVLYSEFYGTSNEAGATLNISRYVGNDQIDITTIRPASISMRSYVNNAIDSITIDASLLQLGVTSKANFRVDVREISGGGNTLYMTMKNLPTSRSRLRSGDVWRDGEFLKIVP